MPRGQKCWRCHAKPCCQWWGPNPSQRRCWPYFSFARGRVDSTWPGMVCPWCSCSSAFPRLAQPPVRNWWMTLGTFPWGVMASFLQWFLQWHQEPLRRPLCQFWKNAHLPLINYIRKFHQIPTYHTQLNWSLIIYTSPSPCPWPNLHASKIHIAIAQGFAGDIVPTHPAGGHSSRLAKGLIERGLTDFGMQIAYVEAGELQASASMPHQVSRWAQTPIATSLLCWFLTCFTRVLFIGGCKPTFN